MRMRLVLISVLAVIAGGCVSNTNPVLKPEQLITDKSLDGRWVGTDDKQNPPTVDVQPAGTDKSSVVRFTSGDDKKVHQAMMRLGTIGNLKVVEFKIIAQDRDSSQKGAYLWAILRQADAKRVVADTIDPTWLKNYLADHPKELAATMDANKNDDSVTITASTEDFQKFLLAHANDKGAFESMHWVRPSPATQPATGD